MPHITHEQRYTIESMLNQGYKQSKIAKTLGKCKSVISREIRRNADGRSGEYRCELAQKKTEQRHVEKNKKIRFTPAIEQRVNDLLKEDLSPEQVVGRLKRLGEQTVSVPSIYEHIRQDKKEGGSLYKHLRRQGCKYRKSNNGSASSTKIPNRVGIDKRPDIVEEKNRFGDLEVDTIIGKNHKRAILTINDRASGTVKIKKVASKKADGVSDVIIELLQDWIPYLHTITADNGNEFAMHEKVSLNIPVDFYFADPYCSWQRGANENINGLIRQYIPKKTDFDTISDQLIKDIETKLNNRPRKRLNFMTPNEKMEQILFNNKVAFIT